MPNLRHVILLIGLFSVYEMDAFAQSARKPVFEFVNQTPETVYVGVGTVKNPPETANNEVKPRGKYGTFAKPIYIDPKDGPELLLKANDKTERYRFDAEAIKKGKNVKVNLTRPKGKKENSLIALAVPGNIEAKDVTIVENEEPRDESGNDDSASTSSDNDDDSTASESGSGKVDEEPADETPATKPKPTLSVTPEQVLGVTPSMKGDKRAAKILGMSFSSDIETATTEPDENQPARLREAEWKKVKKARAAVTAAHDGQVNIWKKVTTTAKNMMKRLKVEDSDEQETLAGEVLDLVKITYKNVKARFAYDEDEKPAEEPADDSSDDDDK